MTAPLRRSRPRARDARRRNMCVPPARKERNGVPMVGRMGGGAKGTPIRVFKPPPATRASSVTWRLIRPQPKSPPFRTHARPSVSRPPARSLTAAFPTSPPRDRSRMRGQGGLPRRPDRHAQRGGLRPSRLRHLLAETEPQRRTRHGDRRAPLQHRGHDVARRRAALQLPLAHPRRVLLRRLQRRLHAAVHPRDALQHPQAALQARHVGWGDSEQAQHLPLRADVRHPVQHVQAPPHRHAPRRQQPVEQRPQRHGGVPAR